MPSSLGTEAHEAITSPLGEKGTVGGRKLGNVCRLQAVHGVALVSREQGMEAVVENSGGVVGHDSYVGNLSDFEDNLPVVGTADIVFRMEAQKRADSLDGLEFASKPDGKFSCRFESAMGSEFVCLHVCDDVAFVMS